MINFVDRYDKTITDHNFKKLTNLVETYCGIQISKKKVMVQARLLKRVIKLGISSIDEYCDYLFSEIGKKDEFHHMVDAITTNETYFFREEKHFNYLLDIVLPLLMKNRKDTCEVFRFWSAGCSSGEEPYTLAMVLKEFQSHCEEFQFSILATDISFEILKKAKMGIYNQDRGESLSIELKKKYFMRGKGAKNKLIRVVPEIRTLVKFKQLNFFDDYYRIDKKMDLIFCRNVIIYFDWNLKKKILNRLCEYLTPGGYLFLGHSEAINNMKIPIKQVAPAIYKKPSYGK